MKTPFHNIITITLLLFILYGCNNFEQVVDIDIPEHKAAISLIADVSTLDTAVVVNVGRSASILNSPEELQLQQTPAIKFFHNNELLAEDFECQYDFCTHLLDQPLPNSVGDSYRIEVSADSWETVSSTQELPAAPIIKETEFIPKGTVDPEGYIANAWNLLIQDPPNQENYYRIDIKLKLYEAGFPDSTFYLIPAYPSSIDPVLSNIYLSDGAGMVCSDATFNGSEYWLRLYDYTEIYPEIHSVIFEVSSITKDAYLFYKSFSAYQDSQFNPFAEPVVVHENIENGHGIFILRNAIQEEIHL